MLSAPRSGKALVRRLETVLKSIASNRHRGVNMDPDSVPRSPRSPLSMAGLDLSDRPLENETFGVEEFAWDDALDGPGQRQEFRVPPMVQSTVSVPLRQWIRTETAAGLLSVERNRRSMLRKTTVAYAMAELLRHCTRVHRGAWSLEDAAVAAGDAPGGLSSLCHLDNFAVRVANGPDATVEGVDMLSPAISLRLSTPFFASDAFFDGGDNTTRGSSSNGPEEVGRFLEVEVQSMGLSSDGEGAVPLEETGTGEDDRRACHLLGVLLYELYSETSPFAMPDTLAVAEMNESEHSISAFEPSSKKKSLHSDKDELKNEDFSSQSVDVPCDVHVLGDGVALRDRLFKYVPLKDLGFPASVSLLVKSLLECGWEEFCPSDDDPFSLKAASDDLHLLIQDPCRFLFDKVMLPDSGGVSIKIKQNELYGRETERSLITDVFCRVSLAGESEALFVQGFSGSGKSRLVQSMIPYVDVAGGYAVQQKFDPISQEQPTAVIISAFNELCVLISKKRSPEELNCIVVSLMAVFGSHLSTLTRVLPGVALLSPELNAAVLVQGRTTGNEINLSRVYYILQLFLRVVSSREHPVVLFLDDIHWADSPSLGILQRILSDIKGASSLFFIGSYRSNEVTNGDPVFTFTHELEACGVQCSNVHLDGMNIEEVNHMISDALAIFPRISKPLSRIVLRKSEGNPLFVLECLGSLAERGLLHYSMRERRWLWDANKIASDDIASNVCDLLATKIVRLSEDSQLALKVASSFGNALNSSVVETLMSACPKYANLQRELDDTVEAGFLNKSRSGSVFTFAHDKVREAAYSLVQNKDRFHHEIGMTLYNAILAGGDREQKLDSMIFLIVDQVNHARPPPSGLRVTLTELNHKAASKAMQRSNFPAAYFYSKLAMQLLPDGHWGSHYRLSLNIYLIFGNAAYAEGHSEEAASALEKMLLCGTTVEEKLDAYYLKIRLLYAEGEGKLAYDTCVDVLGLLGESVPADAPQNFVATTAIVQAKLSKMTVEEWMGVKEMSTPRGYSLMKFYDIACFLSFFVNEGVLKWHARRQIELTLEHGVCKYSAKAIANIAMVLGGKLFGRQDEEAYRLGKIAMKLLERFDASDVCGVYMVHYAYLAVNVEPFQACAAMLKRGSEIGHSMGDIQGAILAGILCTQKQLFSGCNLNTLKKEIDYLVRLAEANSRPMIQFYARAFQETVELLIGKDLQSTSSEPANDIRAISESQTYHQVVRNFWNGHYKRALFFAEKPSAITDDDVSHQKSTFITFYGGLSCCFATRNLKSNKKYFGMLSDAVELMKARSKQSKWNYLNKMHLLEAQLQSAMGKRDEARASFNAAVSAARESKLIHEEGLACEFAALHCLRYDDTAQARTLFEEAKGCYAKWGSQIRVASIERQLQKLAII